MAKRAPIAIVARALGRLQSGASMGSEGSGKSRAFVTSHLPASSFSRRRTE